MKKNIGKKGNGRRVKNYCICQIKNNVLWREQNCPAKYVHNGKKTVMVNNFGALAYPKKRIKTFNL